MRFLNQYWAFQYKGNKLAIGHQLGLRLFLEGVEVPVIAISISIAPDTPVAASIQVIATDRVLELLPRTVIHAFFYDFVEASAISPSILEGGSIENITTLDERNSRYKLLFMGELHGIVFQKDVGSRSVILQCVDFSNYWDTTYQYNFQGEIFGGQQAAFLGANTNLLNSPLGHGVGTLSTLLNSKCVSFPHMVGLLSGIVRCLEAIGGCYYGKETFTGCNDFCSIAELRLKLLQQIVAAEKDNSTAILFARKTFNMWLNRQIGSLGKLVTFRGVVQVIQQFIYHNIFPCPVAKYQPKITGKPETQVTAIDIVKDPRSRGFVDKIKALRKVLMSLMANLNSFSTVNTLAGSTRNTNTGARKLTESDVITSLKRDRYESEKILSSIAISIPDIKGLSKEVTTITAQLKIVSQQLGSASSFILEYVNNTSRRTTALNALQLAVSACDTILGLRIKSESKVSVDKPDRVNNQVLRPDIWFAAPPKCNVLFPELYQSLQWSRNYLREVSRLELQTTSELMGTGLFNPRYYAPDIESMRTGIKLSSRKFGRLILPHELYTGIIPMYEKLSEINLFAMRSKQVAYKGAKIGYAQRAVNHQYFKYRFASRQMSAEGRFNPWFVPGFPSLVIDRPMTTDNLLISNFPIEEQLFELNINANTEIKPTRSMLLQYLVPTQFLGCCTQLQHNLNQQGGSTSYSFEQARIHREGSEFLGVDKVTVSKVIGTSTRSKVFAAQVEYAPKKNDRGPYGGIITGNPINVTKDYIGQYVQLMPTQGNGKIKIYPPSKINSFYVYKITETFTRRVKVSVDMPIEDVIRPPWIWDGWCNLKIGETYEQFFNTLSITDINAVKGNTQAIEAAIAERQEGLAYGSKVKSLDTEGKYANKGDYTDEGISKLLDDEGIPKTDYIEVSLSPQQEEDKKLSAVTLLTIEGERTIENSIDYLVRIYSFIKNYGMDLGEFIRNYTWRQVATMPEIMGSSDFTIMKDPFNEGDYITTGKEGFHSRAFGDVSDLFGLVEPRVREVLGLSKNKLPMTARVLDVRQERRQVVWDYAEEITKTRGLLG